MECVQRRVSRRARFGPTLLLALLAASCASGPPASEGGAAPEGGTVLRVHNTDEAGQTLQVYIAREAGEERLLGSVAPAGYLSAPHTAGQGRFLFRAVRPNGSQLTSPLFTVVSGTYTWDIALGRVERTR